LLHSAFSNHPSSFPVELESYAAGVALLGRWGGERRIQLGAAGLDPAAARAAGNERAIEIGDDEIVLDAAAFGEQAAVAIEDRGVAGADFIVVAPHAVGEHEEHAVVVGPGGQPAVQPAAAFIPLEL